jgi:DNA-binding LacI/PurR family transcriptional regulator
MQRSKVTIKDIARELGISPSTVSKALKNHPDISASTRKAVGELVKKLHYQPDPIALSLKIGQSKTLGVIVPEIVHFFFSTVISGMEDVAYDAGYHIMFCQSNESYEREVKSVETLMSSRVDGILVSLSKSTTSFGHFTDIIEMGTPLVFFDRICDSLDTDRVIVDDEAGAYEAVKHLISQGCRNIVHLCGPQHLNIGSGRKEGYIRALKEFGVPVVESNIIRCDTGEEAQAIVPELLKRAKRPDGIFAVNDLTAVESMRVIKKAGLTVPGDIAIVGFTSGSISDLTDPPLSSVEQSGYQIGKEAVRLLLEKINNKTDVPSRTVVIKTRLLVKGSSLRS